MNKVITKKKRYRARPLQQCIRYFFYLEMRDYTNLKLIFKIEQNSTQCFLNLIPIPKQPAICRSPHPQGIILQECLMKSAQMCQ